jgi:hypothetical protein
MEMSEIFAANGKPSRGQRREQPCVTCQTSTRRGLLWLGGGDYLTCPDCDGTGTLVVYEKKVEPPRHFAVHGFKPVTLQKRG